MYFRITLKMKKPICFRCFTWIVFIELNFTDPFLLIRKTWDDQLASKVGEWGVLRSGGGGECWYPFKDYDLASFFIHFVELLPIIWTENNTMKREYSKWSVKKTILKIVWKTKTFYLGKHLFSFLNKTIFFDSWKHIFYKIPNILIASAFFCWGRYYKHRGSSWWSAFLFKWCLI